MKKTSNKKARKNAAKSVPNTQERFKSDMDSLYKSCTEKWTFTDPGTLKAVLLAAGHLWRAGRNNDPFGVSPAQTAKRFTDLGNKANTLKNSFKNFTTHQQVLMEYSLYELGIKSSDGKDFRLYELERVLEALVSYAKEKSKDYEGLPKKSTAPANKNHLNFWLLPVLLQGRYHESLGNDDLALLVEKILDAAQLGAVRSAERSAKAVVDYFARWCKTDGGQTVLAAKGYKSTETNQPF